jgi:glycerate 2-kinase
MKILVAMDSFKGSLSAAAACRAVARGLESAGHAVRVLPIADGGEGTAAAFLAAGAGEWIECRVAGPLPEKEVAAGYAWFPAQRRAVIEMAAASGLTLLAPSERDPLRTGTFGSGQLIAHAAARGAREIMLAVGGSATVDGGIGAAAALGWRFCDRAGRELEPVGGSLPKLDRIICPPNLKLPPVEVLCDVRNPLNGPAGAARVYAPQKGADERGVDLLERGLLKLAAVVERKLCLEIGELAGGGAAGGLAAGAVAFMGARLCTGIDAVLDALDFDRALTGVELLVTGEGSFDRQSLYGKAVAGLAARARRARVPVAVIAGLVSVEPEQYRPLGIRSAHALVDEAGDTEYAIKHAAELLESGSVRCLRSADL